MIKLIYDKISTEFGLWIKVNSTMDEKLLLEFDISKSVIENKLFVKFLEKSDLL